jgi:hypothetical protein
MKKLFLAIILITGISVFAQAQHFGSTKGKAAIGLGVGLPYGGFGTKLSVNPVNQLSAFLGLGYNTVGVNYNAGLQYIVPSKKQTEFFLTAMYGYNAVIKIKGTDIYNQSYSGFSGGAGLRINSNSTKGLFWDIGLLIPARSSAFQDDFEDLENNPMIEGLTKPMPVLFFAGVNFPISRRE